MNKLEQLKKYEGFGVLLLRFLIGFHLIYGTQDNIFSWERMLEFEAFLDQSGFPVPLISAVVSVYAQFFCGILYIIGYKIRWTALVMIINFIVALVMVEIGNPYPNIFPALVMLTGSVFFLIYGAGDLSAEKLLRSKVDEA